MVFNLNYKKGMTLVEVIMAITILAVVAIPLFSSFNTTFLLINKKQKSLDNNVIVRLAKENAVDCIKDSKQIQSYNDVNNDTVIDNNDTVSWLNATKTWNYPDLAEASRVSNLILKDSSGKEYSKYVYSIKYEASYNDSNFPNVNKFLINVSYRSDLKKIKEFFIFVNTKK